MPTARYLLDRGCRVTGIDSSSALLRLARTHSPEATCIAGDMTSIEFSDRYDGVVAWDLIFHIPKARHQGLFHAMYEWVRPGASVFLSLCGSEDEFTASMVDVNVFYSGHSPEVSLKLLRKAGFGMLLSEVDDPTSRGHLALLCRNAA